MVGNPDLIFICEETNDNRLALADHPKLILLLYRVSIAFAIPERSWSEE
jgi:hypothetical protein